MFDITSSKLLILGLVALMVIGPKDLPALLRTIGKYMGIIKRHANDFRAQFDEAMRETELDQLKTQVDTITRDAEASMRDAEAKIEQQLADAKAGTDPAAVLGDPFAEARPAAPPADAEPAAAAPPAAVTAEPPAPAPTPPPQTAEAPRATEKSGA